MLKGERGWIRLILGILFSTSLVKAENPYRYFTWTVTYGTASPLGVPQQVCFCNILSVLFEKPPKQNQKEI